MAGLILERRHQPHREISLGSTKIPPHTVTCGTYYDAVISFVHSDSLLADHVLRETT